MRTVPYEAAPASELLLDDSANALVTAIPVASRALSVP